MTTVEIKNGKVFINGEETTNPELIGYAILDVAEYHTSDKTDENSILLYDERDK